MGNLPPADFEIKLITALKSDKITGLSSDAEFLEQLNQNLSAIQQPRTTSSLYWIWFSGIFNGLAAAAVGIILFISLQLLPPFLVDASITGAGLIQTKIVDTTVTQNVLWRQLAIDIQKLK